MEQTTRRKRISLGTILFSSKVLTDVALDCVTEGLNRHAVGDWGDVGPNHKRRNDEALLTGDGLHSAYTDSNGARFWIITDQDRSVTTVQLPGEYPPNGDHEGRPRSKPWRCDQQWPPEPPKPGQRAKLRARAMPPDRLPPEVSEALDATLQHFWRDEATDYEAADSEARLNHVFRHLYTLDCWLKGQPGWLRT